MPYRVFLLSLALAVLAMPASAQESDELTCPPTTTVDGRVLRLRWAEVMAGSYSLAPIEGKDRNGKDWQEPRKPRKIDEIIWDMRVADKPASLRCMYSNSVALSEAPDIIVPIPDDIAICRKVIRSESITTYVIAVGCSKMVSKK